MLFPALAALCALASAIDTSWNEGVATHFEGVGVPFGACGVPDSVAWRERADTTRGEADPFLYVALNVFDAPGDYRAPGAFGPRPLTGASLAQLGTYANGANCGRWIRVEWDDECDGINDGATGQPFCRGGSGWHPDARNGAALDVLVFDQCSDANAWCRDSRFHLDIHTPALNAFTLPGVELPPLAAPMREADGTFVRDPNNPLAVKHAVTGFNNRKIRWRFRSAPGYSGEPRFHFTLDSERWYKRLVVTHLPEGIHGLEQWNGSAWETARMEGDAGQMWILPRPEIDPVRVRIVDALDRIAMDGRSWTMRFPAACGAKCVRAATPADDVRGEGGSVAIGPKRRIHPVVRDGFCHIAGRPGARWMLVSPDGRVVDEGRLATEEARVRLPSPGAWIVALDGSATPVAGL